MVVAAIYTALAIAYSWPLVRALGSVLPNDTGDPGLIAFVLWWNAHAVPFTDAWWNAPMFEPARGALAFSDTLLGLSPFASPLQWMGLTAVATHNVVFVCAIITSALGSHALARQLTGRHDVAFIAGLAFGFAPYRAAQLPHLQLLVTAFMPFGLLALHRYLASSRRRWLVVFGLCWVLNGLISGYYLVFFAVFVALWLLWFVRERRHWLAMLLTLMLASVPFQPLLAGHHRYQAEYGMKRSPEEILTFSADLKAFWAAPPSTWLAPSWTFKPDAEGELYPGAIVVFLTLAGVVGALVVGLRRGGAPRSLRDVVRREPSVFGAYAFGALAMMTLALGPVAHVFGVTVMQHAPYSWLMAVPGGDSLRVPARFGMLAMLCLGQSAALALARFTSGRPRPVLIALLAVGVVADGWLPHLSVAPVPPMIALPGADPNAIVLEVPIRNIWSSTAAMLRATGHGHGVVNGFSGYAPPHEAVLEEGLGSGDVSVIETLRRVAPLLVLVNQSDDGTGAHGRFVSGAPDARLLVRTAVGSVYQFPKEPPAPTSERLIPVARIDASVNGEGARAMTDGWRQTSWSSGSQFAGIRVTATLERTDVVSRVEMDLESAVLTYPRGLRIEGVDEGGARMSLWDGGTAGPAMVGVLRDWRRAPVVIDLPPTKLKQLTLTLTVDEPSVAWTIAELRILGR